MLVCPPFFYVGRNFIVFCEFGDRIRFSPKQLTTSLHATIRSIETLAIWSYMSTFNREITNTSRLVFQVVLTVMEQDDKLVIFHNLLVNLGGHLYHSKRNITLSTDKELET